MAVCIIGKEIQTRFFSNEDPIGKRIKCGNNWLTIVGVLQPRSVSRQSRENLGIRNYNSDIYVPISSALLRFKDRATFAQDNLRRRRGRNNDDDENYHQLDRVVVRVQDADKLQVTADLVARLLKRRHYGLIDFQIQVPELLLEQQQKTQETFNLVLAAIAAISLLVGGIGIMNIMLASVLERIKEVGIRRSLGATERDIVQQFLFESIFISLLGGLIGVVLGVLGARIIASSADIPTVVSAWSVLLSFGVASAIGLVFGIVPAQRAARQDPISALRN
jgi:putative ABC transport system permease protein